MARKKASKDVFVVVRRGWEERYGDDWSFSPIEREADLDGRILGRPVAVCADEESAEARAAELEREERELLNPFLFVGTEDYSLEEISSLSPKAFAAQLKKLFPKPALPKEKAGERDWLGWWAKVADGASEEQRAAVWGLLDRLTFYGVIKAEMG